MKIAFLIQCHRLPKQLNELLNVLDNEDVQIFVHADKKSDIKEQIILRSNVHLLPDEWRVDVKWGKFSQVSAAINLLKYSRQFGSFDFYWQISGQDFPIKNIQEILSFLQNNKDKNFINLCKSRYNGLNKSNNFDKRAELYFPTWMSNRTLIVKIIRKIYVIITGGTANTFSIYRRKMVDKIKPCFGSSWWCLNNDFVEYAINKIEQEPKLIKFFNNVSCPDESFFQTLFMNSPYVDTQAEYLHYIDWSAGGSSPKNLTIKDYNDIVSSDKFFARKIDGDFGLIEKLKKNLIKNR